MPPLGALWAWLAANWHPERENGAVVASPLALHRGREVMSQQGFNSLPESEHTFSVDFLIFVSHSSSSVVSALDVFPQDSTMTRLRGLWVSAGRF